MKYIIAKDKIYTAFYNQGVVDKCKLGDDTVLKYEYNKLIHIRHNYYTSNPNAIGLKPLIHDLLPDFLDLEGIRNDTTILEAAYRANPEYYYLDMVLDSLFNLPKLKNYSSEMVNTKNYVLKLYKAGGNRTLYEDIVLLTDNSGKILYDIKDVTLNIKSTHIKDCPERRLIELQQL